MAKNRPTRPGASPTITPAGGGHNNPKPHHNPQKHPPLKPLPQTGILPSLGISGDKWRKMKKPAKTQAQANYQQWLQQHATTPTDPPQGPQTGGPIDNGINTPLANAQQNQRWLETNIDKVALNQATQAGGGVYQPGGADDYTQWFEQEYLPGQSEQWLGAHDSSAQMAYDPKTGQLTDTPNLIDPAQARTQYLRGTAARNSAPSQFMNPTGRWSWWD